MAAAHMTAETNVQMGKGDLDLSFCAYRHGLSRRRTILPPFWCRATRAGQPVLSLLWSLLLPMAYC